MAAYYGLDYMYILTSFPGSCVPMHESLGMRLTYIEANTHTYIHTYIHIYTHKYSIKQFMNKFIASTTYR